MAADQELLARYVDQRSQEAFGKLVARHIDLVYASARRQMGNAELAEDVTQAVFIMLTTKAATLRADVILPAWLLTATWYACKNAKRQEHRRRIHERGASLMRRETGDEAALPDPRIGGMLDKALMSLRESDRAAVVMHYLQGQTFNEVAAALGVSEAAAQKRVVRAVEKLREQFRRQGDIVEPRALADGLSQQASQVAPAALHGAVLSATAKNATAGAAQAIADAALRAMTAVKVTFVAGTCAAVILLTGVGVALVAGTAKSRGHNTASTPRAAAAPAPSTRNAGPLVRDAAMAAAARAPSDDRVTFRNAYIVPITRAPVNRATLGHDPAVSRRAGGDPTGFIASTQPVVSANATAAWMGRAISAVPWRGKHVELSADLRSENIARNAALHMLIWSGPRASEESNDAAGSIIGTRDWTRTTIVLDVPADATRIEFGVALWGPGRVWMDGFAMQSVPASVPTTSKSDWHLATQWPAQYQLVSDASEPRSGRPTARMAFGQRAGGEGAGGGADEGASSKLRRVDYDTRAWRGRRVRVSAMIKAQDVAGSAGVFAIAGMDDAQGRYTQTRTTENLAVRGTTAWSQYSAVLDVPQDTIGLEYGVRLQGAGTLWVDEILIEPLP